MSINQFTQGQLDLIPLLVDNVGAIVVMYLYFAVCLHVLARKTQTSYEWLAWIPIANLALMLMIGKKPIWWILLMLIPIVNIVILVLAWMAIARVRGKAGWIGILIIVPLVNLFVPAYLAFSD